MLSKNFKSNKFYEVTRYFFKYGSEDDPMENTVTVWDSLDKAKAYIDRYNKGLKFTSATVEEMIVDKEITADEYKNSDFNYISCQQVYEETSGGIYEETKGELIMLNNDIKKQETTYKVHREGSSKITIDFTTLKEAKSYAKYFSNKDRISYLILNNNYDLIEKVKPKERFLYFTSKEYPDKFNCLRLAKKWAREKKHNKDLTIYKVIEHDYFNNEYIPVCTIKATKTLKDWENSHQDFSDFAKVGDVVSQDIINYFADILPPKSNLESCFQSGEPYSHRNNPRTSRCKATYLTFAKENEQWIYKGHCFYGETENIV